MWTLCQVSLGKVHAAVQVFPSLFRAVLCLQMVGAVLKESFDVEVQSCLCSSHFMWNSCPSTGFKRNQ